MSSQLFILAALISVSYGFILLPQSDVEERMISLTRPEESFDPTFVIVHNFPGEDQQEEVIATPANRIRRQINQDRPQMPSGQHGQIDVYGEHRRQDGKSLGTDLNIQATGRLWESRDGRSTLDANANYQRHYGGPSGTTRPNYGGGINFNHRF